MRTIGTSVLVLMAATTLVATTVVTPAEAIRASVLRRLGVAGVVDVVHVATKVTDEVGLVAEPEATARLGKPARLSLQAGPGVPAFQS